MSRVAELLACTSVRQQQHGFEWPGCRGCKGPPRDPMGVRCRQRSAAVPPRLPHVLPTPAQPPQLILPTPVPPSAFQADRDSSLRDLGRLLTPAVFGTPRRHNLPAADGGLLSDTGALCPAAAACGLLYLLLLAAPAAATAACLPPCCPRPPPVAPLTCPVVLPTCLLSLQWRC